MPPTITKAESKLHTFRASIIGMGKYLGKSDCIFIKATTREDAHKFAIDALKKSGSVDSLFKVDIFPSSKTEMEFFKQNLYKNGYLGIVN